MSRISNRAAARLWPIFAMASVMGVAHAGTLYTIDTSTHELQTFNTQTLAFSNVGAVSAPFDFGDLAYDGSTMYMSEGFAGSNLYTVNLSNASTSLVGNTGVSNLFGLTCDASGNMYGSGSTGTRGFYSVNKTTGQASMIGDPGVWLDGLAYIPNSNMVVGIDAGPGVLYSINTSTGVATALNNGAAINNCGVAWDADTQKLWVLDWSGNVFTIDPNNNWTTTRVMSGLDPHDGLASATPAPEPVTMFALGAGVLALVRRRKRA